ncbi:MAG: response regulator transcription factor [Bacteroidota bacterium]
MSLSSDASPSISIAIIEDEAIVRRSIVSFFEAIEGYQISYQADSVEAFLETVESSSAVDIILLDINLPGICGIQGLPKIKSECPTAKVIILTTFEDPEHIFEALQRGAISYILKRSPIWEIKSTIDTVHAGGAYMSPSVASLVIRSFDRTKDQDDFEQLSPRQKEVLDGIVDGLSYKKIAKRLSISEHTTNDHVKAIYKRLHVNSKSEAIAKAVRIGGMRYSQK